MARETGWVIERYMNSQLGYWAGRNIEPSINTIGPWSAKPEDAIRFARAEDASIVLAWLLSGNGRVAEHVFGLELAAGHG